MMNRVNRPTYANGRRHLTVVSVLLAAGSLASCSSNQGGPTLSGADLNNRVAAQVHSERASGTGSVQMKADCGGQILTAVAGSAIICKVTASVLAGGSTATASAQFQVATTGVSDGVIQFSTTELSSSDSPSPTASPS